MSRRGLSLVFVALALGCGGETIQVGPPPTPPPVTTAPLAPPPTEIVAADPTAGQATYADSDFVEADTNRDPFRAYTNLFVPHTAMPEHNQRIVIMRDTAVDEMHLIAIVSGVANPSAMLVGGDETGHTVHRGDFVGRAEVVQTGGEDSVPVTLNWRVERIRDGAVILSREDPTAPNRPPLTREIALHDPSEATEVDGSAQGDPSSSLPRLASATYAWRPDRAVADPSPRDLISPFFCRRE